MIVENQSISLLYENDIANIHSCLLSGWSQTAYSCMSSLAVVSPCNSMCSS